jgi:hypothetical protein
MANVLNVSAIRGIASLALIAPCLAQATIYHPPLSSLEMANQIPLDEACKKLAAEISVAVGPTGCDDLAVPSPALGVVVRFDPPSLPSSVKGDGYHLWGDPLATYPDALYYVDAPTERGMIEGIHGLRLWLRNAGHVIGGIGDPAIPQTDPDDPYGLIVNPAFERRGFMVLIDEHGYTGNEWKDLIDYHQLLGANTLTVGLPGLYLDTQADQGPADCENPTPAEQSALANRERYEADMYAIVEAMRHCQKVGVKFQSITGANMMVQPFYWEHYKAERALYDKNGDPAPAVPGAAAADDPVGAEQSHDPLTFMNDDGAPHELLDYAGGASLPKLDGNTGSDPTQQDLKDVQKDYYRIFAEADAMLVVTAEGATDLHESFVTAPVAHVSDSFQFIRDQIADEVPTPADRPELLYWGWMHDFWHRVLLDDYDYSIHQGMTAFNSYASSGSYQAIYDHMNGHNTGPFPSNTPVEWVQEVGFFYFDMSFWALVVPMGFVANSLPVPYHLIDPLGSLDDFAGGSFDKTAYLYWNHKETDPRNYFPRPAIRSTIAEMRAALRKDTRSVLGLTVPGVGWESGKVPATGVMGYRFWQPQRRALNDYVVLRCASDETFLDVGIDNLNLAGLEAAQDRIVDELALFLAGGAVDPARYADVRESIDKLDDAQQLIHDSPTTEATRIGWLEQSLEAFLTNNTAWWNVTVGDELKQYYQQLAFLVFIERAGFLGSGHADYGKLIKAATNAARQTDSFEEYTLGRAAAGNINDLLEWLAANPLP